MEFGYVKFFKLFFENIWFGFLIWMVLFFVGLDVRFVVFSWIKLFVIFFS